MVLYKWIEEIVADIKIVGRMFVNKENEANAASITMNLYGHSQEEWDRALKFIDSIPKSKKSHFDEMTMAEVKAHRLKSRRLL